MTVTIRRASLLAGVAGALIGLICHAVPSAAQTPQELGAAEGRFRFGPVAVTPTLNLTNIGMETNIFNDSAEPEEDFTATFVPAVDATMRAGRARLAGATSLGFVYFREHADQRSISRTHAARVEFDLARIRPFVGGTYSNVRNRPTPEIDVRVRQHAVTGSGGVALLFSAKTSLTFEGRETRLEYDNVTVEDSNLRTELSNNTTLGSAMFRQVLTPLTTWVINVEGQRDRFLFSSLRDGDSIRAVSGFVFKPFALVSGSAFVGFRHYRALTEGVPDFRGLVAAVDVATILRATRITGRVDRDVSYSFEEGRPYYLLNTLGLSVTQKFTTRWDVVGRVSRQVLDYRTQVAVVPPADPDAARRDLVISYGGGLGFHASPTLRLGFNGDYITRSSDAQAARNYDNVRWGGSVTYGF
jgi:hypothetical protein